MPDNSDVPSYADKNEINPHDLPPVQRVREVILSLKKPQSEEQILRFADVVLENLSAGEMDELHNTLKEFKAETEESDKYFGGNNPTPAGSKLILDTMSKGVWG